MGISDELRRIADELERKPEEGWRVRCENGMTAIIRRGEDFDGLMLSVGTLADDGYEWSHVPIPISEAVKLVAWLAVELAASK